MMTTPDLSFSASEFAARLAKVRDKLREQGVAAALFDEIEAMTWISGYGNSENRWRCVAVPVEAEPFFLIRALDAGACRTQTWITEVPVFRDWEDPFAVLAESLAERGLSSARIGLDFGSYGMPLRRFERLKAMLPDVSFVDIGPLVWELRLIKSEAEIARIRRASAIADGTLMRIAEHCHVGSSQRDLANVATAAAIELGADPARVALISAGRGWDFLHAPPDDKPLENGDVVHIEMVPMVGGYSARAMRCICVGPIDDSRRGAAGKLAALQDEQIAAMHAGAEARTVDAILREGLVAQELRESVDNITGYTLGLYAAAGPHTSDFTRIFHPEAAWRLEAGMVFHMYASAAGVSFSETVHVGPSGPERLTKLPRELMRGA